MMHYEFSLVLFTVLIQFCAGLALLIWLAGVHAYPALEKRLWRVILACGVVALGASTTHLANVMHAPFTLTQVGTAWLSREIASVSFFGLLVLLRVLNVGGNKLNPVIALVGLGTVYVVSQVYRVPAVPFWNTIGTELGFFGTALALGGAGLAVFLHGAKEVEDAPRALSLAAGACVAGIMLSLVQPLLALQGGAAALPEGSLMQTLNMVHGLGLPRLLAAVLGGFVLCYGLVRGCKCNAMVLIGFALIVVGEVAGRMLFYAANIRIGI